MLPFIVMFSPRSDLRPLLSSLFTALLLAGCGASTRHEDRLLSALEQANARAAEDKAKIEMLEARLSRVEEQATQQSQQANSSGEKAALEKLDHLIALNQELLLQRATGTRPEAQAQGATSAACEDDAASPREQLQRLVTRLYGSSSGFRGGLSVTQSQALRVLLRPERSLDGNNPWLLP